MKRKPKISISEQLYRAGIWERPGPYVLRSAIGEYIAFKNGTCLVFPAGRAYFTYDWK